jgi:hypothetical protein
MATTKDSAPAHPSTRELRGLALYRDHGDEIEHIGRGRYSVPGCSGGSYTVDLAVFGGEESCNCPDHRRHPEHSCKHLVAATIYRAKARMVGRRGAEERRARRGTARRDLLAGGVGA